jgi:hypothetical protein
MGVRCVDLEWSSRDALDQRLRDGRLDAHSLEALHKECEVRGAGKSAVSARFVVGTRGSRN